MNAITILGLIAGGLTTISSLPQIIHTLKRKQTKDISLPMYIIVTTGIILWIVYGFLTSQVAIIITNGISFVFNVMILFLKLRYG